MYIDLCSFYNVEKIPSLYVVWLKAGDDEGKIEILNAKFPLDELEKLMVNCKGC
jgi:hypothetical protein